MTAPRLKDACSLVMVRDIDETVAFYQDVLGFSASLVSADKTFAILQREGACIHFIKVNDEESLKATAHHIAIYIWVDAIDDLYETMRSKLEALPAGRLRAPFNQDYGMREFHVKDPDGCLLFFAEDIDPAKCARTFP